MTYIISEGNLQCHVVRSMVPGILPKWHSGICPQVKITCKLCWRYAVMLSNDKRSCREQLRFLSGKGNYVAGQNAFVLYSQTV